MPEAAPNAAPNATPEAAPGAAPRPRPRPGPTRTSRPRPIRRLRPRPRPAGSAPARADPARRRTRRAAARAGPRTAAAPARPARRNGDRRDRRPGSRRSRRAARRSRDRSARLHGVASQAFLSFSIVRCNMVPALDSLTPSTRAISAFDSPAWNFRAISSRSRADIPARAARTVVRLSAMSAPSSGPAASMSSGSVTRAASRRRRRSSSSAALRAIPNSHALLLAAPAVEPAAAAGTRARTRARSHLPRPRGRATGSSRTRTRRHGSSDTAPRSDPMPTRGRLSRALSASRSRGHYGVLASSSQREVRHPREPADILFIVRPRLMILVLTAAVGAFSQPPASRPPSHLRSTRLPSRRARRRSRSEQPLPSPSALPTCGRRSTSALRRPTRRATSSASAARCRASDSRRCCG